MKLLPEFFEALRAYKTFAYGIIMVFILLFLPGGLASGLVALKRMATKRIGRGDQGGITGRPKSTPERSNLESVISLDRTAADNEAAPAPDIMLANAISKSFGGLMAVHDLSFAVKKGTIKAIIGPNGAGKSTLFGLIGGILPADTGENWFKGRDTIGLRPFEVNALGLTIAFQTPALFNNLSVLENVMVGCQRRTKTGWLRGALPGPKTRNEERLIRETSLDLLAFSGLESEANRIPSDLPYGQKKMIGIAIALATAPAVLCLDEPAGGLTEAEKEQLMSLIQHINQSGITILLVEHDMNLVMNLADEIMVMNFGLKIAEGTPWEISNNDEVIKAYLGEEDQTGGELNF
jgi:branched-chain amino acid transport system ATP-binding protein